MDEMSMIRRLLAEPPPLPHVVAEGRERLFGSPARGASTNRATRRAAFRSAVGLGLTAAAAAAALAVAALVPGAGTSPGGGDSATTDLSARKGVARRSDPCRVGTDERHLLARAVDVQDDLAEEARAG
jgi:hypothetical protein